MKNCHGSQVKSAQEARLFSDITSEELEYDETPSRRRGRRRRRLPTNQQSDGPILVCHPSPSSSKRKFATLVDSLDISAMKTAATRQSGRCSSIKDSPSHKQTKLCTATSTRRATSCAAQKRVNKTTVVYQMLRHQAPLRFALAGLLVALALTSCLSIRHTIALESGGGGGGGGSSHEGASSSSSSPSKSSTQETLSSSKPSERATDGSAKTTSSASSEKSSIVASLSSAVATAAAAAAVAAAQNSLSSSDARSLGSSHHANRQHHGHPRSPGVNLAIKLVDTIPEVPYNILHNMKKLDHAAPFYNVPNKLAGGATKESSSSVAQNFLTTALAATQSGNLGGAAEQLSSLFKSPLWKRIADGYGDFASEFRSLFRAPGAQPMKGPASPTTKLIRDISVPALLMLLASSISGEWRPVRTRRKSFRPVDIPSAAVAGEGSTPSFALAADMKQQTASPQFYQQQQYERPQSFEQSSYAGGAPQLAAAAKSHIGFAPSRGEWLEQVSAAARQVVLNQPQPQQQQVGPLVRVNGDSNLQHSVAPSQDSSGPSNWISSMQTASFGQDPAAVNFDLQQSATYAQPQQAAATQQQQQQQQQQSALARRSDEMLAASNPGGELPGKPLGSAKGLAVLATVAQGGKLISKLLSARDDGRSYRMLGGLVSARSGRERMAGAPSSSIKRDQLSDKQRYSMVAPEESGPARQAHLLSAMAHALGSAVWPSSGKSGSASAAAGSTATSPANSNAHARLAQGLLSRANLQSLIGGGDKTTINHNDESLFMRRQPPAQAEQRDLTKLLPEAWREVVKRTMTTVQQQANVQWKSIEGQLTNWVQDKLKTVAAGGGLAGQSGTSGASSAAAAAGSGSGASASGATVPAPIGNMLASMSSTALNILGLHKNNSSSSPSSSAASAAAAAAAAAAQVSQAKSQTTSGDEQTVSANQRGKLDQAKAAQVGQQAQQPTTKGVMAGVASMLVSVISDRANPAKQSASSPPASSPSPNQSNTQRTAAVNHHNHAHHEPPKSQTLGDLAASIFANSPVSGVASRYPTMTGAQQSDSATERASQTSVSPTAKPAAAVPSTAEPSSSPISAAAHPLD